MDNNKMEENPFSALFSATANEAMDVESVETSMMEDSPENSKSDNYTTETHKINEMVENIFYFTINSKCFQAKKRHLIYLDELANSHAPKTEIDLEILETALFERLMLLEPINYVLPKANKAVDENIIEKEVLMYLFISEQNLFAYLNSTDEFKVEVAKKMRELILRNAVTALKQPQLFESQILCDQLFKIIKTHDMSCHKFIVDIVEEFVSEDSTAVFVQLKNVIVPIIKLIHKDVMKSNLINLDFYVFPALTLFAGNNYLAYILLETCKPPVEDLGRAYQNSLLGALLSISILPKTQSGEFEYFDSPFDKAAYNVEEANLWAASEHLLSNMHRIFLSLLKCSPDTKNSLLQWIANCLHANASRGKLWTAQLNHPASMTCVSDGFMLNLSIVLLMLCQPFCSSPKNLKYLKIDPTYCGVEESERDLKSVHMREMSKETCIIPPKEICNEELGPTRFTATSYNFVTECFYMAHKALDLGYRVIVDKLIKISQELNQIRQTFADALSDPNSELGGMLDKKIKTAMTKLMSTRCVLREPQTVNLLSCLHMASCNWLVQLAIHNNPDETSNKETFAPLMSIDLKFPIDTEEPEVLRSVPEFIVENIVGFLTTSRHFRPSTLGEQMSDLLEPVLSLVLVFMGSSRKMRNPHLRARLAECLATLVPTPDTEDGPTSSMGLSIREKLFKEHPYRLEIVPNLLNVFVGIEVTGENVQFEQKFHYRRPMYLVMDYLWELPEHKKVFKKLSKEAEMNMEAVTPPIFLRFVNLLMNDAVFLLDDALNNMAQIRTMQSISEQELAQRSVSEREEHYNNLRHAGMLARFDNILGKHTISTLEKLTREIKSVFCHPTMVDRIASMLNYFLLHLVGPNQKNFKVKDSKEFDFDPVATVLNICHIYIHLGNNEEFCLAVSQDGRSYSPKLFNLAENVLGRIKGGSLISDLNIVSERVSKLARKQLEDEEALADAPDEFLDPIMSTIMQDPVILPSSKINIDRNTIARHLLSDQSDPFNREPLSMDQVTSNNELKTKIHEWMELKRKEYRENASKN